MCVCVSMCAFDSAAGFGSWLRVARFMALVKYFRFVGHFRPRTRSWPCLEGRGLPFFPSSQELGGHRSGPCQGMCCSLNHPLLSSATELATSLCLLFQLVVRFFRNGAAKFFKIVFRLINNRKILNLCVRN